MFKYFFIGIELGVVTAAVQGNVDCVDYISHLIAIQLRIHENHLGQNMGTDGTFPIFWNNNGVSPPCPRFSSDSYAAEADSFLRLSAGRRSFRSA